MNFSLGDENVYISTNGMAQIGNWMFLETQQIDVPVAGALKHRPLIEFTEADFYDKRADLSHIAAIAGIVLFTHWTCYLHCDSSPLPAITGDLNQREDILLPTTAQGKSPLVVNGIEVKHEITGWKQFGLNGKQYVLQEGPLKLARFRLVTGSKITIPSTINIPKILAKPKMTKKERDAAKATGAVEKEAAFVMKDLRFYFSNIKAQLILSVTWDGGTTSWELKSTISGFLKIQLSGYLYDIVCHCEEKFEAYITHLRTGARNPGEDEDEDIEETDPPDNEENFAFLQVEIRDIQNDLRKSMKDQEAAKGYQKGVFTKKVKQANEIYRELQQQIRDLGDKLNLSIDTEMFEEIVPQGWPSKK
ncbi:hypothetical protein L211DRAFT_845701 [Terfezia boudieri ATCC MYA-4762]|uniref:Uncharacterized protein n=1 Tax=Terfezia boudieri ATCC MYA-4762 TaxID=1051890 RepID=A0A3N4M3X1_9PEZI|nr:hypothetical protein L211DRAFT_845701 [Terfezia boudieri ATCC MYA-4762]